MITKRRPAGWESWILWVIASLVGGIVAVVVGIPVSSFLFFSGYEVPRAVGYVTAGLLLGSTVGTMQWLVLRQRIAQISWWVPASIGGLVLGFLLSEPGDGPSVKTTSLALVGAFIGLMLGVSQWLVLRKNAAPWGWWIPANIVGWALGFVVLNILDADVPAIIRQAAMWAVISLNTGGVLVGLLQAGAGNPNGTDTDGTEKEVVPMRSLLRNGLISGLISILVLTMLEGSIERPDEIAPNDIICTACQADPNSITGYSRSCPHSGTVEPCNGITDATLGDFDGDRIPDDYEDYLLQKFAPKIWLHSDENRWPVNIFFLFGYGTLRYSHERCSDHGLISTGSITSLNLIQQSHHNAYAPPWNWPWKWCEHYGTSVYSDSYEGDTPKGFFLQYYDSTHNGIRPRSARQWQLYGHVYPAGNGNIVVQYWQLYAFNDSFASANHEGDWEFTAVLIDPEETPIKVGYFRHERTEEYLASELLWEGDHHITFSSKGGHGQYPNQIVIADPFSSTCLHNSFKDSAQGFADRCNQGFAWDSWDPRFGRIVNVGEKFNPLNDAHWLRYSGLWGEIGIASAVPWIDFTSGPPGPAYQPDKWSWGVE